METTFLKRGFSFLNDFLNSQPESSSWVMDEEQQPSYTVLTTLNPSELSSVGLSDSAPQEEKVRRASTTSTATNSDYSDNSSSACSSSIPDFCVWGIGQDKSDKDAPQFSSFTPGPNKSKKKISRTPKASLDRNSDRYKQRRERNNISVRKSREKTKSKIRKIEERADAFEQENKQLKQKLQSIRKFLIEFESSFFKWRNFIKELDSEMKDGNL